MTYSAPIVPSLRGALSSQVIRDQFSLIATEFGLLPTNIGGGVRGFTGGQWNNATLLSPTITGASIGSVTSPSYGVLDYAAFALSTTTGLGTGNVGFSRGSDGRLKLYDGSTIKWFSDNGHNLVMGNGTTQLAASTAGGFLYVTSLNGGASGSPTEYTGAAPIFYDYAGNRLGIYENAFGWRYTMPLHTFDSQVTGTYDPASLADGVGVTTTITVTGATVGCFVRSSFSLDLQGVLMHAWVSATNTVSIRFQNESGGTVDLGSGTITLSVANG